MNTAALAARPHARSAGPEILREFFRREPGFAAAALLLALSIPPTLAAMALDPRTLHGVDIWEKVVKFELALAVYCATLAWFAGWLPAGMTQSRGYRIYRNVVLAAIAAEMAWIGGAAANGVASHFNVSTPLMAALYPVMGLIAITLTSASLVYGLALRRDRASPLDGTFRLSLWLGLVMTFALTVLVAGYMASQPGHLVGGNASDAEAAALMGWARDGGDLRVAHFFATHAMHFLPAFGFAASRMAGEIAGRRLVWGFAVLFAAFTLYTLAQAIAGQAFAGFVG